MLLYGSGNTVKARLAWVRRDGSLISHVTEPDWMRSIRLSSDGRRALIDRGIVRTLWTYDFGGNVQTRATFEQGSERLAGLGLPEMEASMSIAERAARGPASIAAK